MSFRKITGIEYSLVRLLMIANIWFVGCSAYKNPFKSFKSVSILVQNFNKMIGRKKLVRAFKLNGSYRWDMFNPGWPSKAFNSFFRNHLHETLPIGPQYSSLRRLIVAITKKCPLNCQHCSEGDTLNNKDALSVDEIIDKIDPFIDSGIGQLVLSGGEPLNRFDDLIKILSRYRSSCDQWIYTSGYGLTEEKANLLKKAGLAGAAISLDHHIENMHNAFRRNNKSYKWVLESVKNLHSAGIFVSINICPVKSYIEEKNLDEFVRLAKSMNVPVVNILEPRSVGNFYGQNVELEGKHKNYLLEISEKYNFNKKYIEYPTVTFPAGYRRVKSCGGGNSYLFLDYDGQLYPCPFCKTPVAKNNKKIELCEAN